MRYVVTYDIVNDRIRQAVADCLDNYGDRVQLSVFEVDLDIARYKKMVLRLKKLIDMRCDGVRIYPVCSSCLGKVEILGQGSGLVDETVIVI